MQTVTRFLRDNAEIIVSVCVVLSVVLGAALFYLTRLPVFDEPAVVVTHPNANEPANEKGTPASDSGSASEEEAPEEATSLDSQEDASASESTLELEEVPHAEPDAPNTHSTGGEGDTNRP